MHNLDFVAGEPQSPGIDHSDRARMQVQTRPLNVGRRSDVPEFVRDNAKLREVIVAYVERRAQLHQRQPGTHAERLERAKARLQKQKPGLIATLDKLLAEYVAIKQQDPTSPRRRLLETEIENLDTQLRFIDKPEVMLAGVIWYYHRCGFNSVETAREVGIKPPHVRVTEMRLRQTWEKIQSGKLFRPPHAKAKGDPQAACAV